MESLQAVARAMDFNRPCEGANIAVTLAESEVEPSCFAFSKDAVLDAAYFWTSLCLRAEFVVQVSPQALKLLTHAE